jgi:small subunit ribosomal protein S8
MAMNDTLATALSNLLNAEKVGKSTCKVRPISKIIITILGIMQDHHYIGEYKKIEDGKGGMIEVNLIGGINKCGAIKPRFSVTLKEFDKFEKRFLPSKDFGLLILSTPKGIMTQVQAKEKGIGGKLLAYIY